MDNQEISEKQLDEFKRNQTIQKMKHLYQVKNIHDPNNHTKLKPVEMLTLSFLVDAGLTQEIYNSL